MILGGCERERVRERERERERKEREKRDAKMKDVETSKTCYVNEHGFYSNTKTCDESNTCGTSQLAARAGITAQERLAA